MSVTHSSSQWSWGTQRPPLPVWTYRWDQQSKRETEAGSPREPRPTETRESPRLPCKLMAPRCPLTNRGGGSDLREDQVTSGSGGDPGPKPGWPACAGLETFQSWGSGSPGGRGVRVGVLGKTPGVGWTWPPWGSVRPPCGGQGSKGKEAETHARVTNSPGLPRTPRRQAFPFQSREAPVPSDTSGQRGAWGGPGHGAHGATLLGDVGQVCSSGAFLGGDPIPSPCSIHPRVASRCLWLGGLHAGPELQPLRGSSEKGLGPPGQRTERRGVWGGPPAPCSRGAVPMPWSIDPNEIPRAGEA